MPDSSETSLVTIRGRVGGGDVGVGGVAATHPLIVMTNAAAMPIRADPTG
jgi:hypothetical protein